MKDHEKILLKNKDFIIGVARYGLTPQRDNVIVKEILEAYKPIDDTLEALHGCATCNKPFEGAFKVMLAYCESLNWFEETEVKSKKK